jgi:hypothetical protein
MAKSEGVKGKMGTKEGTRSSNFPKGYGALEVAFDVLF